MSPSDPDKAAHDRRQRKLLILLALGFVAFGAAASALFYVLQPETLRIAVGPAGSDDDHVVQAMADAFAEESRSVRLAPVITAGAAESLALLGAGKTDLAIGRGDLAMPADAQTLAVLRKNYVVQWAPSGRSGIARRPVMTIAGEQPHPLAVALDDHAVAVMLDFVNPFRAVGYLGATGRDAGLIKRSWACDRDRNVIGYPQRYAVVSHPASDD